MMYKQVHVWNIKREISQNVKERLESPLNDFSFVPAPPPPLLHDNQLCSYCALILTEGEKCVEVSNNSKDFCGSNYNADAITTTGLVLINVSLPSCHFLPLIGFSLVFSNAVNLS